jgi:hypothetical protein
VILCRIMGGSIDVESEPGVGTTFSVRLPADRPGIPDAAPIKTAPALASRAPARTNRVLVIDDDATVRDLMRRYLSREGFDVVTAGDRPFTVMMEQPLKRSRCAEQGHVYFLPHDCYRHVNAFDTREHVGHQIAPLVGFGISPIRDLIVRRAVNVMEDGPRQSPPCHRAEIPDVVASIDTHWLLRLCELKGNRPKSCAWAVSAKAAREAACCFSTQSMSP